MLRLGKDFNEVLKHQVKAILRFGGTQFGDGRLGANNQLHFWDDLYNHLSIRSQSRLEFLPPAGDLGFCFGEQLLRQRPKCLYQRCVGNIALKLVKFSGDEVAALLGQGFVDFLHQG